MERGALRGKADRCLIGATPLGTIVIVELRNATCSLGGAFSAKGPGRLGRPVVRLGPVFDLWKPERALNLDRETPSWL
jgi:hypothetical protein